LPIDCNNILSEYCINNIELVISYSYREAMAHFDIDVPTLPEQSAVPVTFVVKLRIIFRKKLNPCIFHSYRIKLYAVSNTEYTQEYPFGFMLRVSTASIVQRVLVDFFTYESKSYSTHRFRRLDKRRH
jgi:hypothetical protein